MFGKGQFARGGRPEGGAGFGGRQAGPRGGGWSKGDDAQMDWGMDGRGRGGGGGGGRKRMFDGGELRIVLLKLISEKPRHGYELIRAIEELTGGAYAPSPGIVYPTLTLLGEMGYIGEQEAEGARKLFAITPEGATHLEENAAAVVAIFARLDAIGAMRERTDFVPVRRAMHNLRSVLQNRLGEELDKERLHAVVALIDEAARKIEML